MLKEHSDKLYTFVVISLLIISVIFAGGFYIYQRNLGMQAGETIQQNEPTKVGPSPTMSVEEVVVIPVEKSVLKIAIPHDSTGFVTDAYGNRTGIIDGVIANTIPFSEYTPDDIAKTVNWVIIEEPATLPYTLHLTGTPEKAVAVYVVSEIGAEDLELIQVPNGVEHEFTLTVDTKLAPDMIKVN